MPLRASELAEAGNSKASHANYAVVSKRALAAAIAWWWRCMAEREKGQGPQWRNINECAHWQILLHLFVCILPRGLPLVLCWCWMTRRQIPRDPISLGWPELRRPLPLRESFTLKYYNFQLQSNWQLRIRRGARAIVSDNNLTVEFDAY